MPKTLLITSYLYGGIHLFSESHTIDSKNWSRHLYVYMNIMYIIDANKILFHSYVL